MASLFPDHEPTREARKPAGEFHDQPRRVQKKLLTGLDLPAGTRDLFDVDGADRAEGLASTRQERRQAEPAINSVVEKIRELTRGPLLESLFDHKGGQPRVNLARSYRATRRTGMSMFNRGPRRGEPGWRE